MFRLFIGNKQDLSNSQKEYLLQRQVAYIKRFLWPFFLFLMVFSVCMFVLAWIALPLNKLQSQLASAWQLCNFIILIGFYFNWQKNEQNTQLTAHQKNQESVRQLSVICLIIGLLWASIIVKGILTHYHNSTQVILIIGVTYALITLANITFASLWRLSAVMIVPDIIGWCMVFFIVDEDYIKILASVCVLLMMVYLYLARIAAGYITSFILLHYENIQLISQLQDKTQQAEVANKAKTQFLAAASHDLRQPVHALNLFIAALENTALTTEQQSTVKHARSAAHSSQEMLDSILDYAHIESGSMQANLQPCELAPILYQLEEEFAVHAEFKELIYRTRNTPLWVVSDATLLMLILRNLISNAIRYTESGGVLVSAWQRGSRCCIAVCDTGRGIEAEQIDGIFNEFHQLQKGRDKNQGLGLGLATVKRLASLLETQVRVFSKPKRGSKFYFHLDLVQVPSKSAITSVSPQQATLAGRKILVVDDEVQVLNAMQILLSQWHCEVRLAETAQQAGQISQTFQPDMLISDYQLSNSTANAVIEQVKQHCLEDVKIIIITGNITPEIEQEARRQALVLLHKPVNPYQLRHELESVFCH